MATPVTEVIYDSLAQCMQERKIYQTSKGYFIVTPEWVLWNDLNKRFLRDFHCLLSRRRRSRSRPRSHRGAYPEFDEDEEPLEARTILMTNSEALHSLYGEISTERDGDLTHQCIQTNLADVICGGENEQSKKSRIFHVELLLQKFWQEFVEDIWDSFIRKTNKYIKIPTGNPNDKIMYPRTSKRRSASFPTPRSLERRHSLRFFGSSKRLQRCASTRSLSKTYAQTLATDSSSSEYQSTDSSSPSKLFYKLQHFLVSKTSIFRKRIPLVTTFSTKWTHKAKTDRNVLSAISTSWMV